MSKGTVRPERSSHKRIVSAEEAWVVTRRICGGREVSRYGAAQRFSRAKKKHAIRSN